LRLQEHRSTPFKVSHLRYASLTRTQYELTVKVHRVFPSYCGRNLPDKEFRYLRTVIVTADIHWDLKTERRLAANKIS
jgi:hypothetical protein